MHGANLGIVFLSRRGCTIQPAVSTTGKHSTKKLVLEGPKLTWIDPTHVVRQNGFREQRVSALLARKRKLQLLLRGLVGKGWSLIRHAGKGWSLRLQQQSTLQLLKFGRALSIAAICKPQGYRNAA
jgi:hypothetical protein